MVESRVRKSLLNAKVNLTFYALTLLLTFFSRRVFFDCLGAEFLGFTTTLQNILGFLNLAELGIGTAIGYILYKPLFHSDKKSICEIISVLGYLYRCIGLFIFTIGVIFSLFLPFIFSKTNFSYLLIFFAYYSFLISSLIGYFINYRQTLLGADQRNYVVTGYFQSANILKTFLQMGLAYYTGSYYLWIAIELFFGIVYTFILNWKINQVYPWLKSDLKNGYALLKKYPKVIRLTKQMLFHKLGAVALWQITPLIIYAFSSLTIVALYSNYTIITSKLNSLFGSFMDSTSAGVGNLIAEGDLSKVLNVFWELASMRYFIGATFSFCIYILADPFITLWLGAGYTLDNRVLFLICISTFISYSRGAIDQFINGFGLFWDIWAPVVELSINIGVACLCGYYWGLPGVLFGGVISQILVVKIWKPCLLFYFGMKKNIWNYIPKLGAIYFFITIPMLIVYSLADKFLTIEPTSSYLHWGLYASIVCTSYVVLTFFLMYIFIRPFRNFVLRLFSLNACLKRAN